MLQYYNIIVLYTTNNNVGICHSPRFLISNAFDATSGCCIWKWKLIEGLLQYSLLVGKEFKWIKTQAAEI
jgi:hypothetical protein